jgi:hypothetical protein
MLNPTLKQHHKSLKDIEINSSLEIYLSKFKSNYEIVEKPLREYILRSYIKVADEMRSRFLIKEFITPFRSIRS